MLKYNRVVIETIPTPSFSTVDHTLFPVRQVGEALGFGSHGGNLSHHVRGRYRKIFRDGVHYIVGYRGRIYMHLPSLLALLGLVAHDEPKRAAEIMKIIPVLVNHKEIA